MHSILLSSHPPLLTNHATEKGGENVNSKYDVTNHIHNLRLQIRIQRKSQHLPGYLCRNRSLSLIILFPVAGVTVDAGIKIFPCMDIVLRQLFKNLVPVLFIAVEYHRHVSIIHPCPRILRTQTDPLCP